MQSEKAMAQSEIAVMKEKILVLHDKVRVLEGEKQEATRLLHEATAEAKAASERHWKEAGDKSVDYATRIAQTEERLKVRPAPPARRGPRSPILPRRQAEIAARNAAERELGADDLTTLEASDILASRLFSTDGAAHAASPDL